nr:hypothetical protein [uncultured Trichococcus sp.]
MNIDTDAKKDIILNSFNILKDDVSRNLSKIVSCIAKMSTYDIDMSKEMWTYIVKENISHVSNKSTAYDYCGNIAYEIERKTTWETVAKLVGDSNDLKKIVFGESGDICISTNYIIIGFLKNHDFNLAQEALELIYNNKNNNRSFSTILEELIEEIKTEEWSFPNEQLDSSGVEILLQWSSIITNPVEKARINIALLDYL